MSFGEKQLALQFTMRPCFAQAKRWFPRVIGRLGPTPSADKISIVVMVLLRSFRSKLEPGIGFPGLATNVNDGPPRRIFFRLAQYFMSNRGGIAFTKGDVPQQI